MPDVTRIRRQQKGSYKTDPIDVVIGLLLLLFAIIVFYPFYNAVLTSFVTSRQYALNPLMLYPQNVTFDNYRIILKSPLVWSGYANTLIVVVFGTIYSLSMTISMAYAFSRKFPGKVILFSLVLFTMFFSGGLIPLYLLMKNLGLMGQLSSVILVHGVAPFYMIIMKNGFEQIPDSLVESAKIEGANDIVIFLRIMLPLQMALLATLTLFIIVDRWNDWFLPMLFIKQRSRLTLQVVLRSIIHESASDHDRSYSLNQNMFSTGIKIAAVVITMLPIMCIYPFLQKYFVKGILVGAIKM